MLRRFIDWKKIYKKNSCQTHYCEMWSEFSEVMFQKLCEPVTTESEGSGSRIFLFNFFYFHIYCHVQGRFLPMRSLLKTTRELLECNLSWRVSQMEYFASVRLCELSPSSRIQTAVMNNEKYWRCNVPWCAFLRNALEKSSAMFLSQKSESEVLFDPWIVNLFNVTSGVLT